MLRSAAAKGTTMAAEPTTDFAAQVRRYRLLAGLSQEGLAERAGLSVRGISALERGLRRAPHPAIIARMADALGLDTASREALLMSATRAVLPGGPEAVEVADLVAPLASADIDSVENTHQSVRPGERRWVTVLAVQLGGLVDLAQRLDPEDLHALPDKCINRLSAEIHRLDGTLVRATADSIVAVCGAPLAHEDDAERAVRAGLAIRDCEFPAARDAGIQVRIGIETGEVLAAGADADAARHYAVSGMPAIAAEGLAACNSTATVLVGRQTYQVTRMHVRYQPAALVHSRDWPNSLEAWEALDVRLTPGGRLLRDALFVGRGAELDALNLALERVLRENRAHVVSVLGEPGIGKSRLIAEFERGVIARSDVTVLHGRCLAYGEAVGYAALNMALYYLAGITPDDAAEVARARLGRLVRQTLKATLDDPNIREIERRLALLSGLDTPTDLAGGRPDERSMHVSVRRFLETLARDGPICLFIEDLHWADSALLRLLEHVAEHAQAVPLLLVTQARPELLDTRPGWGGGIRAFTSLLLEPIDVEAGLTLADALCREHGLAPTQAEGISRAAGGNPLFAEELTAVLGCAGQTRLARRTRGPRPGRRAARAGGSAGASRPAPLSGDLTLQMPTRVRLQA